MCPGDASAGGHEDRVRPRHRSAHGGARLAARLRGGARILPSNPSPFEGPWDERLDVVALGGVLDVDLVLDAYRHGVFPFYGAGQPVQWWCPDPRAVLGLDDLHVPRRLARTLARREREWSVRTDTAFEDVVRACDENRVDGTWIHEEMVRCYVALRERGHAHSLEIWANDHLVGGIYGVAVGGLFAAESKFHRVRDASKAALVCLVRHLADRGYELLDVQFTTPHLEQFGVVEIPRAEYLDRVRRAVAQEVSFEPLKPCLGR